MSPTPATSQCLFLVRSTLEVADVLRRVHPRLEPQVLELEQEVESAGQLLLEAGSVATARLALDRIHEVRLALEILNQQSHQAPSRAPLTRKSSSAIRPLTPQR